MIIKDVLGYCNTRFKPTTDNYTLDFTRKFYTCKAPLLGVLTFVLNNCVLKEDKDYYVYPKKRIVEIDEETKRPVKFKKSLFIQYTYGYTVVPQTVKDVVLDLVNLNYKVSTGELSDMDFQSESWDSEYSYTKLSGDSYTIASIRKNILSRLDPYVVEDIGSLPDLNLDDGNVRAWLV